MSSRDLARFGQLYLRNGSWQATRILPPSWVAESTRPISDFGDGTGYGFMWWTYGAGALDERYATLRRYDAFAGLGTGGQLLLVVPDADFVFVHRGDTDNSRPVSPRIRRIRQALHELPGPGRGGAAALTESEFTIMPVARVRIVFERDADGRVTGFRATIGPQRFNGRRLPRNNLAQDGACCASSAMIQREVACWCASDTRQYAANQ